MSIENCMARVVTEVDKAALCGTGRRVNAVKHVSVTETWLEQFNRLAVIQHSASNHPTHTCQRY